VSLNQTPIAVNALLDAMFGGFPHRDAMTSETRAALAAVENAVGKCNAIYQQRWVLLDSIGHSDSGGSQPSSTRARRPYVADKTASPCPQGKTISKIVPEL
jgi:hypothetical protein